MKVSEVDKVIALAELVDVGIEIDSPVDGETPRQTINRCLTLQEIAAYLDLFMSTQSN